MIGGAVGGGAGAAVGHSMGGGTGAVVGAGAGGAAGAVVGKNLATTSQSPAPAAGAAAAPRANAGTVKVQGSVPGVNVSYRAGDDYDEKCKRKHKGKDHPGKGWAKGHYKC